MEKLEEWRTNANQMYERLDTIRLDWPTLTCQWSLEDLDGSRAFVATDTGGNEPELVKEVEVDTDCMSISQHEKKTWKVPMKNVENQTQEQQRVRQCPCNSQYMASFSAYQGTISIWDKTQNDSKPVAFLTGHTKGGFGMDWEPYKQPSSTTKLVSGDEDGALIMWRIDMSDFKKCKTMTAHNLGCAINDVTWTSPSTVVVALENGEVHLFDQNLEFIKKLKCSNADVTSASISPFSPHLLLMGTSDNKIKIWDIRTETEVYENEFHTGEISCCKWSPHRDGVFASTGKDSVVYIWDIKRIGTEQSYEDSLDGVPELMFTHNGQITSGMINDLDWHPLIDMLLLSADCTNMLMSWQPNSESIDEAEAEMPAFLK